VGFFDEVIDASWLREEPPAPPPPPWCAPPRNIVPAPVAVQAIVELSSDFAIWIDSVHAYPTGLACVLNIRWRSPRSVAPPFIPGRGGREGLCLGFETEEGHRAISQSHEAVMSATAPARPVLVADSARHGDGLATVDLWTWPRVGGVITWVVEWRRQRLRERRVECLCAADALDEAGNGPQVLWELPQEFMGV
jgi:hypothetical protein